MRRTLAASLLAIALSACAANNGAPLASAPPALQANTAPQPAPLSELVSRVDIPYEKFVLANGLTVLVHTDRKSPIVG
ncbi:MAG: hypothetical protein RL268_2436, partial [Pseudomonadota bacterium]